MIRPIICYAAAVWSLMSANQMNRLGLLERNCLRYCVNSRRQIGPNGVFMLESNNELYRKANIQPISNTIVRETVKFFDGLSTTENQLIRDAIGLRQSLLEGEWKPPWYAVYLVRNNQLHPSGGQYF